MTVADVFDALTHARPYKFAWTTEEAVAEIKKLIAACPNERRTGIADRAKGRPDHD